jgi:hypothetical protein
MFSGRHQILNDENKVFIDRNPAIFQKMIDYVSNGQQPHKIDDKETRNMFDKELEYWLLKPNPPAIQQDLTEMLNSEPENVHTIVLEKWKEIGPLNIE